MFYLNVLALEWFNGNPAIPNLTAWKIITGMKNTQ